MRNAEQTRDRIDKAALRLFVERGVAETTTRDIANAAKIAEGTIYRHYRGKDQLAASLYARCVGDIAERLAPAADPSLAFKEQLAVAINIFCRLFDERPLLFRFVLLQRHNLRPKAPPLPNHPMQMLTGAVKRAIARREIGKCDPVILASMILGLVTQVAISQLMADHDQPLRRVSDILATAALRVVEAHHAV